MTKEEENNDNVPKSVKAISKLSQMKRDGTFPQPEPEANIVKSIEAINKLFQMRRNGTFPLKIKRNNTLLQNQI